MWPGILVSLYHYKNTNRRLKIVGNTNGSHFKLPEEVFNLVTNIDNKDDAPTTEYKTKIEL